MKLGGIKGLAAAICAALCLASTTALAAEELLASTELELAEEKATAELWGERLNGGYAKELLLLLKAEDGRVLTAYTPTVKGGYNCRLAAVQVLGAKVKNQQLLLAVGQGDWQAGSEFRVLSLRNRKQVREIFGAVESMGAVKSAAIKGGKLQLSLVDGNSSELELPKELELQDGRVDYGGLHSLTLKDIDDDGVAELFSSQRLTSQHEQLADVGIIWDFDKETKKWKYLAPTVTPVPKVPAENTVNDGCDFSEGTVLSNRVLLPGGEGTYPSFACKEPERQNKINELLTKESADYLEQVFRGKADMAFKVMRADAQILSLQLISGKSSFVHHQVNIDPQTGEQLQLSDILDSNAKDLLPLLNLLNTNEKVYYEALPDEWYIEDDKLYLLRNIDGVDQVSGYALGNLHKFLLRPEILTKG